MRDILLSHTASNKREQQQKHAWGWQVALASYRNVSFSLGREGLERETRHATRVLKNVHYVADPHCRVSSGLDLFTFPTRMTRPDALGGEEKGKLRTVLHDRVSLLQMPRGRRKSNGTILPPASGRFPDMSRRLSRSLPARVHTPHSDLSFGRQVPCMQRYFSRFVIVLAQLFTTYNNASL